MPASAPPPLIATFLRMFVAELWKAVWERIIDGVFIFAAFIYAGAKGHLSVAAWRTNSVDVLFPFIWAMCAIALFHLIRTGVLLHRQIARENITSQPVKRTSGLYRPDGQLDEEWENPIRISHHTSKVVGVVAFFGCAPILIAYGTWKLRPQPLAPEDHASPILEHKPDDGYLQPERTDVFCGSNESFKMTLGSPIRLDVHYFNRGSKPVEAAYLSVQPRVVLAPPTHPNLDAEMRSAFRTATDQEYATGEISGKGSTIISGRELWNTGYSEPLTSESIKGLKKGTWRLYFLSRAIWKNDNGAKSDFLSCTWATNLPDKPGRKAITPVHNCD